MCKFPAKTNTEKMFKFKNRLSPTPVNEIFKECIRNYDLRKNRLWETCKVISVYFGTKTIRSIGPKTWDILPQNIKDSKTLTEFKIKIKNWSPNGCTCRLSKTFIPDLGFIN